MILGQTVGIKTESLLRDIHTIREDKFLCSLNVFFLSLNIVAIKTSNEVLTVQYTKSRESDLQDPTKKNSLSVYWTSS